MQQIREARNYKPLKVWKIASSVQSLWKLISGKDGDWHDVPNVCPPKLRRWTGKGWEIRELTGDEMADFLSRDGW